MASCREPGHEQPLVALSRNRQFCRFCGKEENGDKFLNLQSNEKYYTTMCKRLQYMNIKPAHKLNMKICKSCHDSFNSAYNFCKKFNFTQVALSNFYYNEEVVVPAKKLKAANKRVLANMKEEEETSVQSSVEMDVEKVDKVLPSSDKRKSIVDIDKSWNSYKWTCCHCDQECDSLVEIRAHSKKKHSICFGFECPDCDVLLDDYLSFIGHVRNHKENLRYYCDICDEPIDADRSHDHVGDRIMCRLCGEIVQDVYDRERHQHIYRERYKKDERLWTTEVYIITVPDLQLGGVYPECHTFQSWNDYVWVCTMCDIKFHTAKSLRFHSYTVHDKCCTMKCLDCHYTSSSFYGLFVHIMRHRPSLTHFCPFCNRLAHSDRKFRKHIRNHLKNNAYCSKCGIIIKNINVNGRHEHMNLCFWFLEPMGHNVRRNMANDESNRENDNTEQHEERRHERKVKEERGEEEDSGEEEESEKEEDREKNDDAELQLVANNVIPDSSRYSLRHPKECDACLEPFIDKRLYKVHTNTNYCPICDKAFNCLTAKEKHLSSKHLPVKPYECYKCGRCHFTQKRAYACMESHLGEETKMCRICRSMVLATYLIEHEKVHCYDTTPLDEACGIEYCTMQFESWIELVNHRQAKHLAKSYRKVRNIGRYLTQRNLLHTLPASDKLPIEPPF